MVVCAALLRLPPAFSIISDSCTKLLLAALADECCSCDRLNLFSTLKYACGSCEVELQDWVDAVTIEDASAHAAVDGLDCADLVRALYQLNSLS